MKETAVILTVCVVVLALVAPGTALAGDEKTSTELNQDAKRAKINEVAKETLDRLFSENANAKEL